MAEIIIMPKLGFNMSEGKLVKWYKKEGDPVKKGEPVFAIETDKTSIDIEATTDGIFRKRFIEEGDAVAVTLPIAVIAGAEENIDAAVQEINQKLGRVEEGAAAAASQSGAGLAAVVSAASSNQGGTGTAGTSAAIGTLVAAADSEDIVKGIRKITPRARRVAAEQGVDLAKLPLTGTGYQGGVCEKDILEFIASDQVRISPVARKMAQEQGLDPAELQGTGINGKILKRDVAQGASIATEGTASAAADTASMRTSAGSLQEKDAMVTEDGKEIKEIVPYAGVRKIIGERLAQSKFTAPHLYFTQKVDLEKLLDLRTQINAAQEKKTSVTDYIAKAVIKCLQKYPDMNESLLGDKIVKYQSVNLGIAVAAPGGLIVPVIKNANHKSVVELSKEAGVLFEKARNGKLRPDEYTGGTFTISNLGMFGIENFTAIINPPEVGILAVSATKDEAVVVKDGAGNKSIEIRPLMNINLTVDHRVIDGLLAAQFVTEIKRLLENPIELMI